MKAFHKMTFIILMALASLLVANALTNPASAASSLSCQVNLSANNHGVAQVATYTYVITNTGPVNLGAINVTIPFGGLGGGYINLKNLAVTQQPSAQNWNINNTDSAFILLTGSGQGLTTGQAITFTFDITNPQVAGNYVWYIQASQNTTTEALNIAETAVNVNSAIAVNSVLPALAIVGIATGIAFLNTVINRVLINYFVGWEQYRVMQKEMAEFRSESMAAARANDKKQMEKLKKKQSQMNNMQSKMVKPQIVQFGISFLYLIVWFLVLTPTFGNISMAYIPGFGPISVFYLYPIFSLFIGLLAGRIIGINPIEQR